MPTPTTELPTWATDATVTSGPDTGLSTREAPAAATRAQGYIGDQAISARVDNYRAGSVGDWISYLAPIQVKNWRADLNGATLSGYTGPIMQGMAAHAAGWLIPLTDSGEDDSAGILFNPGPIVNTTPSAAAILPVTGAAGIISVAHNPGSGLVMLGVLPNAGDTALAVWTMGETGSGLTKVTTGETGVAGKVVFDPHTDRFLLFPHGADAWETGAFYWHTANDGVSWVRHTVTGSVSTRTIGQVLAANDCVYVSFVDAPEIRVSSNGGDNWVLQTLLGGTAGVVGITNTANGMFCLDFDGQVYRQTGDIWTPIGTALSHTTRGETKGAAFLGSTFYGNHICSDGGRLLVVPWAQWGRGMGVYWSIDYGLTWHTETIQSALSDWFAIRGIVYGGDEFLLVCQTPSALGSAWVYSVYRSLRV